MNPQPVDPHTLDQYDLIIVVDTSADRQLPGLGDYLINNPSRVLVIDHHLAGDGLGDIKLINTRAAAAAEIVFNLITVANWPIDPDTATALFVALATDTGWFRFENVTDQTYQIAGKLTAAGAQPHQIYRTLFQKFPAARLKLMTQMLQTLELFCNERLAIMHITTDMINQTGAKRTQIENMVNQAQQIDSVEVTVLLVEQKDQTTRASFRSRGNLDVNQIAQKFNGGGHANAAGATLNLPITDARNQIINTLTTTMS
ncbi:MAG: bifunctional oligoribonuclease/PAP phosphatase NrnA [Planctomycetes bacterium]|nr:bifunctional oligoribonuclease/PAP phosphatase NrnA [Planctomycetota bacterium]